MDGCNIYYRQCAAKMAAFPVRPRQARPLPWRCVPPTRRCVLVPHRNRTWFLGGLLCAFSNGRLGDPPLPFRRQDGGVPSQAATSAVSPVAARPESARWAVSLHGNSVLPTRRIASPYMEGLAARIRARGGALDVSRSRQARLQGVRGTCGELSPPPHWRTRQLCPAEVILRRTSYAEASLSDA